MLQIFTLTIIFIYYIIIGVLLHKLMSFIGLKIQPIKMFIYIINYIKKHVRA